MPSYCGKNSCCLWYFLFVNETTRVDTVTSFFSTHGLKLGLYHVRIDQGGELTKIRSFYKYIATSGYTLETTGSGVSFQNAIMKIPHQTLAEMMRTMLSDANLSSLYWSHAIRHDVYIKT